MSDPSLPAGENQPGSTEPGPAEPAAGRTCVLNLEYKLAGLFCYLPVCAINLICSIMWFTTEPKTNRFLRFHALQSLFMCGAVISVGCAVGMITITLAIVPFLNFIAGLLNLLWMLVVLVFIWQCVMCMIDAYHGKMTKLPIIGDLAEQNI